MSTEAKQSLKWAREGLVPVGVLGETISFVTIVQAEVQSQCPQA